MSTIRPLPAGIEPLPPGLHYGIPAARYHADNLRAEPTLSSGVLRTILGKSIEHGALEHPRIGGAGSDATPAMNLGSITHSLLAGDDGDIVLGNFDSYRTKAAQDWKRSVEAMGKTPALERDMEGARPIAKAVREKAAVGITNDPFAPHGRSEVTALWNEGDVFFRARYDRLVIDPSGYADIWDYKTTADIGTRAIERAIVDMGYQIQAAFYLRGLTALLPQYIGRTSFIFCFVENDAPYHVRRVTLSPAMLAKGAKDAAAGIDTWRQALATNDFTAPPFETHEVSLPAFLEDDDEITTSAAA